MDMYTDSDLALKLKKWSLEKMNYFSSNLENSDTEFHAPSDSDFNRLTCGQMNKVWSYVIDNIRTENEVSLITGNMKFYQRTEDDREGSTGDLELDELIAKKEALTLVLTSNLKEEKSLQSEVAAKRAEFISSDKELVVFQEQLKESTKNKILSQVHAGKVESEIKTYEKYLNILEDQVEFTKNQESIKHGEVVYINEIKNANRHTSFPETNCMKDYKEACECVSSLFNEMLLTKQDSTETEHMRKKKAVIDTKISKLYDKYTSTQLIISACANTYNHTKIISDARNKIEIVENMHNLSYRFGANNELIDFSHKSEAENDIIKMIQQMQRKHIQCCMETLQLEQSTKQKNIEMTQLRESIREKIQQKYCNDSAANKLANSLFDMEMRMESQQSALLALRRYATSEEYLNSKRLQKLTCLKEKFSRIKNFNNECVNNEKDIKSIISQNNGLSKIRINTLKEINDYKQRKIADNANTISDIESIIATLKDNTIEESKKCEDLKLVTRLELDKNQFVSVDQLSINRLMHFGYNETMESKIISIFEALKLERKCPTVILTHICDHLRYLDNQNINTGEAGDCVNYDSGNSLFSKLQDIQEKAEKLDGKHTKNWENVIHSKIMQAELIANKKEVLKTIIENWWKQPLAHALDESFNVDNKSYNDWLEKWDKLTTANSKRTN